MKNFEKEAKDQLDKYKSPTELTPLWDKINLELRPRRKYGALLLWPLLLGSIALILAVVYNQPKQSIKQIGVIHATNIITNDLPNSNPSDLNRQETNTNVKGGDLKVKPIINSVFKSPDQVKSDNNAFVHNYLNEQTSSHTNNQLVISKNSVVEQLEKEEISSSFIIPDATIIDKTKDNEPALIQNLFPSQTINNEFTNSLDFKLFPVKVNFAANRISPLNYKLNKYNSKDRFSLYLGIYGGYGIPVKTITAKGIENKAYEISRKASETILEDLQIGAFLGTQYSSGLFVEAGFEYNRINERFDYLKTTSDTIGKYIITGYIVNTPGDTSYIKDSINVLRINKYNKKIYNKYSFYSLPITLGYEFNKGSRTRFYVKGGVMVNMAIKNEVEILDKEGVPTKYLSKETASDYPFKTKIGLIPFVSLGARYNLNATMEVFGELNYKHINDITADDYTIEQHYDLFNVNIGLQFHF